jgi:hypothetical protein
MKLDLDKIKADFAGLSDLRIPLRKREVLNIARQNWGALELARTLLEEYLERITSLSDGEEVPRISFNPNGFVKMEIIRVGKTALRLHVHCPDRQVPENGRVEENAHDHRWSLCSTLITGQMEHTIFSLSDTGSEYAKFSYYPRGAADSFSMNYEGMVKLRETSTKVSLAFHPLLMDAWLIHRVKYPSSLTTATLVLTDEDRDRDFNYVYTTPSIRDLILIDGKTPAPSVSIGDAADILSDLLKCF